MRSPFVFSLSSGLLFTAVMAVFFMCLRMGIVEYDYLNRPALAVGGILGLVIGVVTGSIVGLRQTRPVLGFILGMYTGIIFGTMAGLAMATPRSFSVLIGGSVVIIGFSLIIRAFSNRDS